jgi:hypothetical protein
MNIELRQFNEDGINAFGQFLSEMKTSVINSLPIGFLTDEKYSVVVTGNITIDIQEDITKKDLILYLHTKTKNIVMDNLYYRPGLWSWIAAAYIDVLCPQKQDGSRVPKSNDRYILNTNSWNRYYRHLIASPVRLYNELSNKELAEFYLSGPPHIQGDIFEQLASRQEIATVEGILEAAINLYWDQDKIKPKVGAADKNSPGTVRRFVGSVLPQFQMTYDINSMSGEEIFDLLPSEFDIWK